MNTIKKEKCYITSYVGERRIIVYCPKMEWKEFKELRAKIKLLTKQI